MNNIASLLCCWKSQPTAPSTPQNPTQANGNSEGVAVTNLMHPGHPPVADMVNETINNHPAFAGLPHFAIPAPGAAGNNALPIPHVPSQGSTHADIGDEWNDLGEIVAGLFNPHNLAAAAPEEPDLEGALPEGPNAPANFPEGEDDWEGGAVDIGGELEEQEEPINNNIQQQQLPNHETSGTTSSEASSVENG